MSRKFTNKGMQAIIELVDFDKKIVGLEQQRQQHIDALKGISDIIKRLKKNRNKKLMVLVGGNIIDEVNNREALKILVKRKEEVEMGKRTIEGQIKHREEAVDSLIIKCYRMFNSLAPEDVKDGS